jgi:hypothetical protein
MALRPTLQVRWFFCPCNDPVNFASIFACPALCRLVSSRHRSGESLTVSEFEACHERGVGVERQQAHVGRSRYAQRAERVGSWR